MPSRPVATEHPSLRRTEIEQRLLATDGMPSSNLVAAMYSDDVRWLLERWDETQVAESDAYVQGQQLAHALADVVVAAADVWPEPDAETVTAYIVPVGLVRRGVSLLSMHGIDAKPGQDGRTDPTRRGDSGGR